MDKRLTAEQVEQCERIIKAFVSALILDTDPIENEAHKCSPCPIPIWEDNYSLDNDSLKFVTPKRGPQDGE